MTRRRLHALLLSLPAALTLAACSSHAPVTVTEATALPTDVAEGPTTEVSRDGTLLIVRLEADMTTGYEWGYEASVPGVLAEIGSGYTPAPNPQGLCGVGGTAWWVFEATGEGTTTLTFTYARPWDPADTRGGEPTAHTVTVSQGRITLE